MKSKTPLGYRLLVKLCQILDHPVKRTQLRGNEVRIACLCRHTNQTMHWSQDPDSRQ